MQIASEIERILADDGRTGTQHLVAQLVELFEGYGVESAKPKDAEGLMALAAASPTILKAGHKLTADRVSGKVVVGCYGDVPAVEFKRLAAMLSAAGDGNG
jgi:hypothetical protein